MMIKNTNNKMTTNSQLPTTEPKKIPTKQKRTEQTIRSRNTITEMEITWSVISGEGLGENGGKVQGIRSIHGRYKIDRRRLGIVWEIEKPKNLYVQPMDMN